MMRGTCAGAGTLLLVAAVAAGGAIPKKLPKPATPAAIARTLDCGAHRFETTIQLSGPDGKLHEKTVRMCGTEGETDAGWIATLKDAVKKTADSAGMAPAAKQQIIGAVNAEIARLSHPELQLPQGPDIQKLPRASASSATQAPLARDYNALPPLPTASTVPPPHLLGADGTIADAAHVSLRCAVAGDEDRPERCGTIDKDTILVVRADAAYPNGLAVRFVRHGGSRAEVDLPSMAAGDTRTFRLPGAVCTGVVRTMLEIDAVAAAPSAAPPGRVGDYDLRC